MLKAVRVGLMEGLCWRDRPSALPGAGGMRGGFLLLGEHGDLHPAQISPFLSTKAVLSATRQAASPALPAAAPGSTADGAPGGTPGLVGGRGSSLCRGITKGTQRATHRILCELPLPGRPGLSFAMLRVSFLRKSPGARGRKGVFVKEAGKKGEKKEAKAQNPDPAVAGCKDRSTKIPRACKDIPTTGGSGVGRLRGHRGVCTHCPAHGGTDDTPQHPTALHALSPNVQPGWDFPRATSPATASFCLLTVPGTISGDQQPGKPHGWTTCKHSLLASLSWSRLASLCKGMGTGEKQILPGSAGTGALEEEQL